MKKHVFIAVLLCLSVFLVTACASYEPLVIEIASGYEDHSFDTPDVIMSKGKLVSNSDLTFWENFILWPLEPKAVRQAAPEDIVCIQERISNGFFRFSLFGVNHEKWTGRYTIRTDGISAQLRLKGHYSGFMYIDEVDFDQYGYGDGNASLYSPAPYPVARFTVPEGKTFILYKVEETAWTTVFTTGESNADYERIHQIPSDSRIQITDSDQRVYAEYNQNDRTFVLYECSAEDALAVKRFLGAWYSINEFNRECTRRSEDDE